MCLLSKRLNIIDRNCLRHTPSLRRNTATALELKTLCWASESSNTRRRYGHANSEYLLAQNASADRQINDHLLLRHILTDYQVTDTPTNYDAWFDYVRLMEEEGDIDKIRDTYERAISNVPAVSEKKYWRRYIYLWIYYAIYEELTTKVSYACPDCCWFDARFSEFHVIYYRVQWYSGRSNLFSFNSNPCLGHRAHTCRLQSLPWPDSS